jgi:hypothetical protein
MDDLPAEVNRSLFEALQCADEAIDILVGGGKNGNNASG